MALMCPVCKASNENGPTCRRCRADLAMLFAVEDQRKSHIADARCCLDDGELVRAAAHARRADDLRHGPDVAQFRAVLALLQRDFHEAWKQYRRALTLSGG